MEANGFGTKNGICNFNVNTRYKPDVYVTECREWVAKNIIFLEQQPFAPNINDMFRCQTHQSVRGGAGFFGEVQGPCGWKDSKKYDCCFTKCRSKWKTRLWPFKIYL